MKKITRTSVLVILIFSLMTQPAFGVRDTDAAATTRDTYRGGDRTEGAGDPSEGSLQVVACSLGDRATPADGEETAPLLGQGSSTTLDRSTGLLRPDARLQPLPTCSAFWKDLGSRIGAWIPILVIGGAAVLVFYFAFWDTWSETSVLPWALSAGGADALKKVIMPTVWLTPARMIAKVSENRLASRLGLRRPINIHKATMVFLMAALAIHAGAEIYKYPDTILGTREGKTGAVMLSVFPFMAVSYALKQLPWIRDLSYPNKFLRPHQIAALAFMASYAVHREKWEKLAPWALVPVAFLVMDRLAEYMWNTHDTYIAQAEMKGSHAELSIAQPEKMTVEPGQWVYLQLDGRDHPFTVARVDERRLYFTIAPGGPDTRRFINRIESGETLAHTPVRVKGPYPSSAYSGLDSGHLFVVSSGSGSSVQSAILEKRRSHPDGLLTLAHSERDYRNFLPILQSIQRAIAQGVRIDAVHFFNTGPIDATTQRTLREAVAAAGLTFTEEGVPLFAVQTIQDADVEAGETAASAEPVLTATLDTSTDADAADIDNSVTTAPSRCSLSLHDHRLTGDDLQTILRNPGCVITAGNPEMMKLMKKLCRSLGIECELEDYGF